MGRKELCQFACVILKAATNLGSDAYFVAAIAWLLLIIVLGYLVHVLDNVIDTIYVCYAIDRDRGEDRVTEQNNFLFCFCSKLICAIHLIYPSINNTHQNHVLNYKSRVEMGVGDAHQAM
ncbi:hypothetical protein TSUD_62520 [Trifolium subterraneum]|uniref:Choline transporter-like protein n=1 Tax=Trifolium subterraneum TaxID=3900 RepID=A0A2Z6N0V4_TRISU|nr:hypothetical protein TSUD_62520 [Trifolium subterraneum]